MINKDGYLYPPTTRVVRQRLENGEEHWDPQPRTSRPAFLYTLPASHALSLNDPAEADAANGDASFLANVLSYLYGWRLQLDGWKVDGRLSYEWPTHHVHVDRSVALAFTTAAYDKWRAMSPAQRTQFTTLLFLHAKAPSYEWPWEQFLIEYVVTDALYALLRERGAVEQARHVDRIPLMCAALGVWCGSDAPVLEIVGARNALFHQGLWSGDRPGATASQLERDRLYQLRSLNQRLVAAFVGGLGEYHLMPWTHWQSKLLFA